MVEDREGERVREGLVEEEYVGEGRGEEEPGLEKVREVEGERVRELAPDIVRERVGVGVEEGQREEVGHIVEDTVNLGDRLLDNDPLGLQVGGNISPVVVHPLLHGQGIGVERPGVGQKLFIGQTIQL